MNVNSQVYQHSCSKTVKSFCRELCSLNRRETIPSSIFCSRNEISYLSHWLSYPFLFFKIWLQVEKNWRTRTYQVAKTSTEARDNSLFYLLLSRWDRLFISLVFITFSFFKIWLQVIKKNWRTRTYQIAETSTEGWRFDQRNKGQPWG